MSFFKIIFARYPKIFCRGITRINNVKNTLYLTFDDGPNPMITEKVLLILEKYNAKASFFCKGQNCRLYPEILEKIKKGGHTIGNHSYSHLNALKVSNKKWLIDVLRKSPVSDSYYFRPPYGKILPWQCYRLKKEYKLVFWDVLTYDFRTDISASQVIKIIRQKTRDGSVIVFHDTALAASRMLPALEDSLKFYSKKGYRFDKL
jgi:peptidoglycan/xylan/chitin deacetylase (PgdA/CDA1 family)